MSKGNANHRVSGNGDVPEAVSGEISIANAMAALAAEKKVRAEKAATEVEEIMERYNCTCVSELGISDGRIVSKVAIVANDVACEQQ